MSAVLHGDRKFCMRSSINVFSEKKMFPVIHVFRSDQFLLLMYLCLVTSSVTIKMYHMGVNEMYNRRNELIEK